jgi:hypothetical protein
VFDLNHRFSFFNNTQSLSRRDFLLEGESTLKKEEVIMSGSEEKTNCPNCGNSAWVEFKGFVTLPIIDEKTGRTLKKVEFSEYKCKLCKYVWREKWW